ncbi:hypothetical protein PF002_g10483 [Phytophthora fragariae]|nr:hypothetical protein PF004_g9911 [Phytophthora fragariae]KAE9239008.1 hypothetical protein PF002_g10483 [Phytophthora fragariae]
MSFAVSRELERPSRDISTEKPRRNAKAVHVRLLLFPPERVTITLLLHSARGGRKSLKRLSNSRPTAHVGLRPAARGLHRAPVNYHLRGLISVPGDSRVPSCPLAAANPRNSL